MSRTFLAACRARAACKALLMIALASLGRSSRNSARYRFVVLSTRPLTSVFPSLVFVCPSNCGSLSFTEMTAARPSRISSPVRFSSFSLRRPFCRA